MKRHETEAYQQYLLSREWQKKREAFIAFKESQGRKICFICKEPVIGRFSVHHTNYRNFRNESFSDLRLTHKNCHYKMHNEKRLEKLEKKKQLKKIRQQLNRDDRDEIF